MKPHWTHDLIVAGLSGGGVGGFLQLFTAWWSKRKPPSLARAETAALNARAQADIATAFEKLVNDLQQENARQLGQIEALRKDAHRLRNRLAALDKYIRDLFAHLDVLDQQVIRLGGTPPARPVPPEA